MGAKLESAPPNLLVVGRIAGLYGVKGWLRVHSYTEPRENILGYSPWQLQVDSEWLEAVLVEGRHQGGGIVAAVDLCDDRDAARRFVGADIAIDREWLPPPAEGDYYWADLIGLTVQTRDGVPLGSIRRMLATGANDVMVADGAGRERLIPFIADDVVLQVDFDTHTVTVDWDPEF